jgi:hypothetical protein
VPIGFAIWGAADTISNTISLAKRDKNGVEAKTAVVKKVREENKLETQEEEKKEKEQYDEDMKRENEEYWENQRLERKETQPQIDKYTRDYYAECRAKRAKKAEEMKVSKQTRKKNAVLADG